MSELIKNYKLSDLLTYVSCPLKYSFSESEDVKVHDARKVITSALKDTYLKHLHMLGSKRPWSSRTAAAYFSKSWSRRKASFVHKETQKITTTLLKAHDKVVNMSEWVPSTYQVAVVEMPFERRIRDIIISDTIDAITVKKLKKRNVSVAELWILDDNVSGTNVKNFGTVLRALLGYSFARKSLINSHTELTCHVINVFHGTKQQIILTQDHRVNYPRIIRSIAGSIENNIIYPINSRDNCEYCFFSSRCYWSSE